MLSEPPNLNDLRAKFQDLKKKHRKIVNEGEKPELMNKKLEALRISYENDSIMKQVTSIGSSNKTPLYTVAGIEPRNTNESSQARLDPRQALFQSNQNTLSNEGSKNTQSDKLLENSSNFELLKQLQREFEIVKGKFSELEMENNDLKKINEELTQTNIGLSKGLNLQSDGYTNSIQNENRDYLRINLNNIEGLGGMTSSSNFGNEIKEIKILLEQKIKQDQEEIERIKLQKDESSYKIGLNPYKQLLPPASTKQNLIGRANTLQVEEIEDGITKHLSSASRIALKQENKRKNVTESNKTSGENQISGPSRSDSLSHNEQEQHIKGERNQNLQEADHAEIKQSIAGLNLYHKWKEIIGLEWKIISEIEFKLYDQRRFLKQRKQSVQEYEWDMLWSLQTAHDEKVGEKVIESIKHSVFQLELDSEKYSILIELFDTRRKKLIFIEKMLNLSFKQGKMNSKSDTQLTLMFNQYIDVANLYEHKARINTKLLNPYKLLKIPKMKNMENYSPSSAIELMYSKNEKRRTHQSDRYSSNQEPSLKFDENIASVDFLKSTLLKVKESSAPDWTVYEEISRFFDNEKVWFSIIKEEVRNIMKKLKNPSNISVLRSKIY